MMNFLNDLIPAFAAKMPTIKNFSIADVIEVIATCFILVILVTSIIQGGMALYEGFHEDSPASKRRGLIWILGGIVACVAMAVILSMVIEGVSVGIGGGSSGSSAATTTAPSGGQSTPPASLFVLRYIFRI